MMSKPQENSETAHDIVKTFNEQFAQNYNSHLTLFGTMLSYLGVVVVAYAYVFKEICTSASSNLPVDKDFALTIIFLVVGTLLLSGAGLVAVLAAGFRRDQVVVTRIREQFGVVDDGKSALPIFPKGYDPRNSIQAGKGAWLFWMTDVYIVLYIPFILTEVLLVLFHLNIRQHPFSFIELCFGIAVIAGILVLPRIIFLKLQRKVSGESNRSSSAAFGLKRLPRL